MGGQGVRCTIARKRGVTDSGYRAALGKHGIKVVDSVRVAFLHKVIVQYELQLLDYVLIVADSNAVFFKNVGFLCTSKTAALSAISCDASIIIALNIEKLCDMIHRRGG